MTYELYDPHNLNWPKSEPSVELCHKHDKTLVSYWEEECPLCRAEVRIKLLQTVAIHTEQGNAIVPSDVLMGGK